MRRKNIKETYNSNNMKKEGGHNVIDLFCGTSGLYVEFKVVFENDIEENIISSFKLNHPEVFGEHLLICKPRERLLEL